MVIDYENYKVFSWTERQLKKHYSQEILSKYFKVLAFLYQNGHDIEDCSSVEEMEEQMDMWNNFETIEDFEELERLYEHKNDDYNFSVGKKILSEELYEIIKNSTFIRKEAENPPAMKRYATIYWNSIGKLINELDCIFSSTDKEIAGALKSIKNVDGIKEKINSLREKYEKEVKVLTWIKALELCNVVYSTYIQLSKVKTDTINISKASNLNDELYGSIGGFNPNTGEIKCIIGSAVWELKTVKSAKTMTKIRLIANSILNDNPKMQEDDDGIKYLEKWYKGIEKDDEMARRVVVCSLLHGILALLSLKHNLNFLNDPKNGERSEMIRYEFLKIMEYCGIDKDYLL